MINKFDTRDNGAFLVVSDLAGTQSGPDVPGIG